MAKKRSDSLVKVMDTKDINSTFIPKLEANTYQLFGMLKKLVDSKTFPSRELSFSIMREAHEAETFLDDYGASQNKQFFYFRELIASVRWSNIFIFHGLHILARIEGYNLNATKKDQQKFLSSLQKTIKLHMEGIKHISSELQKESSRLKFKNSQVKYQETKFLDQIQKKILPPDLGENLLAEKQEQVFDILVKFLEHSEVFSTFVCHKNDEDTITEELIEKYRSIFHQVESLYDTYIKNTEIEAKYPALKQFRSHTAMVLHLLEMGTALVHFHERHSEKLKKYPIAPHLPQMLDKETVNKTIKSFVFAYSLLFLTQGKEVSSVIFNRMGSDAKEFIYTTKMLVLLSHRIEDFHIRPIMPITQVANKYKIDTHLYYNRYKYNLKSSIEVAIAIPDIREALGQGNTEIMIQGPEKAVEDIATYIQDKCGAYEKSIVCDIAGGAVVVNKVKNT